MKKPLSVILVGAGNMGGALLTSWVQSGVLDPQRSAVIDPRPSEALLHLCEERGLPLNPLSDSAPYEICVLGVKPQAMPSVIGELDWPGIEDTLFISIAAGLTLSNLTNLLKVHSPNPRVVRTMPNLPAAVGEATTLMVGGDDLSPRDRELANQLFEGAGSTVWTQTEDQLDRLMGISGCGPAYVFLLAEALMAKAMAEGLDEDAAKQLAMSTIMGTSLQMITDGRLPGDLRSAVTSPGGTTAAALSVLNHPDRGFLPLVNEAVDAAYARALEMRD